MGTKGYLISKKNMMKRVAFKMKLKPGRHQEYEKRHAEIWPELKALLKENGISEYSIFFDHQTNSLFAFQKVDGEANSQDLGKEEVIQKWWKYMADLMEVNADNSPITSPMDEVFYMD